MGQNFFRTALIIYQFDSQNYCFPCNIETLEHEVFYFILLTELFIKFVRVVYEEMLFLSFFFIL